MRTRNVSTASLAALTTLLGTFLLFRHKNLIYSSIILKRSPKKYSNLVLLYLKPPWRVNNDASSKEELQVVDVIRRQKEMEFSCYACGLEDVDPEADAPGSYCDLNQFDDCPDYSKIYNHSCNLMDEWGPSDAWRRICPKGVTSCFYIETGFAEQAPVFRGCANTNLRYENGCKRMRQNVPYKPDPEEEEEDAQQAEIMVKEENALMDITLCYCDKENCNQKLNGRNSAQSRYGSFINAVVVVAVHLMCSIIVVFVL